MIDALIGGKIAKQPEQRQSKSGKPFVTTSLSASVGNGESVFVSVIAFDPAPCRALLALDTGDSVSIAGSLTPKTYTAKDGTVRAALDMVANQVLSPYAIKKKREATQEQGEAAKPSGNGLATARAAYGGSGDYSSFPNDDLPT